MGLEPEWLHQGEEKLSIIEEEKEEKIFQHNEKNLYINR